MHLITSKLDQNVFHKLDQKLDQRRINRSMLEDAILNKSLMLLITIKFDQNIIHNLDQKQDQKRINRSKLDAI